MIVKLRYTDSTYYTSHVPADTNDMGGRADGSRRAKLMFRCAPALYRLMC